MAEPISKPSYSWLGYGLATTSYKALRRIRPFHSRSCYVVAESGWTGDSHGPNFFNGDAKMQGFHSIVWKQGRSPVEREVSAFKTLSEVIAGAESRASQVRKNFPGMELDSFDVYERGLRRGCQGRR
jgi:hypothetical protein